MTALRLRGDLIEMDDGGDGRRAKIIDAVSGRVARITRRDLKALHELGNTDAGLASDAADRAAVLNEAFASGLLRRRATPLRDRWSGLRTWGPMRWLCIRIPLVSIDHIAKSWVPASGLLFHPLAILLWSLAILLAAGSVLCGWDRAVQSAGQLRLWGQASANGWIMITAIFVITKICHELAHAVACRRTGVPCGELGILLFAGIPCPYCNVSLVSRLDSRMQRAGVMLAGVYVELILATLATVLWWSVSPGPVQALAMNVMIVCGVSTMLFNANPLMRLDGYYVLADLVGAVNLRGRATAAWRGLITSRLGGWKRGRLPCSPSEVAFAAYHIASLLYRAAVLSAIAWMVISVFDSIALRPVGLLLIGLASVPLFAAMLSRIAAMLGGSGPWQQTPLPRRGLLLAAALALAAIVLCIPLRREIVVAGVIDVSGAIPVHAGQNGWVARVHHDYEAAVVQGQPLVELDDPRLRFDAVAWDSRKRLASLHSAALRRSALRDDSPDMAWALDAANQELVRSQWQSLQDRQQRLLIRSPADGVILPPGLGRRDSVATASGELTDYTSSLLRRQGSFATAEDRLCRIGDPNNLCVTLFIDARHRRQVHQGQKVRVIADFGSPWVAETVVGSLSEIEQMPSDDPSHKRPIWNEDQHQFTVRCELPPAALGVGSVNFPVGAEVQARIRIGDQSLWQWLRRSWREAWSE